MVDSTFFDNELNVSGAAAPDCTLSFVSRRVRSRESRESSMDGDLPFDDPELEASFSSFASSLRDGSMMTHTIDVVKPCHDVV